MISEIEREKRFLEIFKNFENKLKSEVKVDDSIKTKELIKGISKYKNFKKRALIENKREFLILCTQIRNFYSHEGNEKKYQRGRDKILDKYSYLVAPSEELLSDFEQFYNDFINPEIRHLDHIYVAKENIFSVSLEDDIALKLNEMSDQSFTHAPIIIDDRVEGLFDLEFLNKILTKEGGEIMIGKGDKLKDHQELTDIKKHVERQTIKFMSLDDTYEDLHNCFCDSISNDKRLSMVLFTSDGKQTGKLMGLCTIWDLFR